MDRPFFGMTSGASELYNGCTIIQKIYETIIK